MNGEPCSSFASAFRIARPASTTGNARPHHTTPRSAGSARTKNVAEPDQGRPSDRHSSSEEVPHDDQR